MSTAGDAPRNHTIGLQRISEALIASGYTSLDEQAKALGINRSTAWTIIKTKHKLGRLSTKTTKPILSNPNIPPSVRAVVLRYLAERPDALRRASKRLTPSSRHEKR
jgi:hypothetical protein